MKKKFIWKVQPAPKGTWRSFEPRGWPELLKNDGSEELIAFIIDQDGNSYSKERGERNDLRLKVVIICQTTGRRIKPVNVFTNLRRLKASVDNYIKEHPEVGEKKYAKEEPDVQESISAECRGNPV